MTCVRTPYKDQQTANQVIRKSELSAWKRPNKPTIYRAAYKCECGFWHVKKGCSPIINNFIAETGRLT